MLWKVRRSIACCPGDEALGKESIGIGEHSVSSRLPVQHAVGTQIDRVQVAVVAEIAVSIAALQIPECMIESETCLIEFCGQGGLLRLEKLRMRCDRLKAPPLDPTVEVGGSA